MSTAGSTVQSVAPPSDAPVSPVAGAASQATPAASAAVRMFGVNVLLGLLGLASAAFVVSRLFESWRVTSGGSSHLISVFGQQLSYPVANAGAIAVTALAALGLLMTVAALRCLVRELIADRRFTRALEARSPVPLDGAWVITDDEPLAFCAGLVHPRIYVSTAALELLADDALAAVLAHERHHVLCRDPLRLACGRALLAGLFFIPALRRMIERQQSLAEIGADEAAILSDGVDRSALASAMLSFSHATGGDGVGVDPERIDYLLGEPTASPLPLALLLGSIATMLLLSAVALLLAQVASGTATLAPPGLSSQPCIVVLALIPATAGLGGLACARARAARGLLPLAHE
jgi:Zn-dependent protease with chaperone function